MRALGIGLAVLGLVTFGMPLPTSGDVVQGELGMQLDAQMTKHAADGFSGVLLVARAGHIVISKGYGYADPRNKVPFTSETVFDIGSITKQFTAAAILRLEMDGKLTTDDKITKFFSDVPENKREITLHHLLTHTSGLFLQLGGDYEVAPRDEVVRKMLEMRVSAPPGERHKYSNGGYSVLGAVVDIASGQPYEAYLREQLFLPAGMQHTGYRLPDWSKSMLAHGVTQTGDDWGTSLDKRWADDGPYWNLRANGGILSTVGDMYRWHLALLDDRILSKDAKGKMFTQHVREVPMGRSYYGYGWVIATSRRNTKVIMHNGGNGIFFADFLRWIDDDTVMIIASNDARHRAETIEGSLLSIMFPQPANPQP
jgi:CubicO group peptidase (beta-lactamase class C family)